MVEEILLEEEKARKERIVVKMRVKWSAIK